MKDFIAVIRDNKILTWKHWVLIGVLYTILHIPIMLSSSTDTNLAITQAESFLDQKLSIDTYYWDAAIYDGKYYVPFPPFPAAILTPLVAIFGSNINSVLISTLLSCFSMFLFYRLLSRFEIDEAAKRWVLIAYFFGTGYWYMVFTSHHINGFAHVISNLLAFIFLLEATGKQRWAILGFLLACTFMTRQMTMFYGIIGVFFIYKTSPSNFPLVIKKVVLFGLAFGSFASIYLLLNYLRFDDALQTGYSLIAAPENENWPEFLRTRIDNYGMFNLKYVMYNFYHMFIKGHNIIFAGPDGMSIKGNDVFGTSLLSASPFLLAAFGSKLKRIDLLAYVITILVILVGILLYYTQGWQQVNTHRFALDFMPVLIILCAYGYSNFPSWLFKGMVVYAVLLNLFSFYIHS